jgi:hypothetical protein
MATYKVVLAGVGQAISTDDDVYGLGECFGFHVFLCSLFFSYVCCTCFYFTSRMLILLTYILHFSTGSANGFVTLWG